MIWIVMFINLTIPMILPEFFQKDISNPIKVGHKSFN